MELALVDEHRRQTNHDLALVGEGVWELHVPGVRAGQRYGYRVHGRWSPETGERFNPAKLLLDPYARAITGGVDYAGPITDHTVESNFMPDPTDSFAAVPLSVVVADSPAPTPLAAPDPVGGAGRLRDPPAGLHPAASRSSPNTCAAPTPAWPTPPSSTTSSTSASTPSSSCRCTTSSPSRSWSAAASRTTGATTRSASSPRTAPYSSSGTLGEQVAEFKQMVAALHAKGIAVILDVVYNHTGEGGHDGPTLSFRGIDHGAYYRLTDDQRNDYDVTGCGNAVDTSTPGVLKMVLDSLRYWVADMGVDGFRFDLQTTLIRDHAHHVDQNHLFKQLVAADPVLAGKVMISEPWDLGPYGYQVGRWGPDWSEWNDRFRGFTRDFWRGAIGGVQELATRLSGSSDIFDHGGRPATSSVNFVTAHDGFTMRDVVTYDLKHNEANAERNRDGADDNRSWNHGYEGETDDPEIIAARQRTARNMMATLLLSAGIPMILAGDEMGRTQGGNNNAYCQDSPVSWVNWHEPRGVVGPGGAHPDAAEAARREPAAASERWRYHDEITDAPATAWAARPWPGSPRPAPR